MEAKIEQEKVKLKKRLARLLRSPDNKVCADCPKKRPAWISFIRPQQSFALGSKLLACFVCSECAGKHKELGSHICYIRSISHDQFEKEELDHAECSGNGIVNQIFEGHLQMATTDQVSIKPQRGADSAKRERFIRQKYVDMYFYRKRVHYKQIAEMNDIFAKPRSTTKVRRQNLSAILKNPINVIVGRQDVPTQEIKGEEQQERCTSSPERSRSKHRKKSQNQNRSKSRTKRSKPRGRRGRSTENALVVQSN